MSANDDFDDKSTYLHLLLFTWKIIFGQKFPKMDTVIGQGKVQWINNFAPMIRITLLAPTNLAAEELTAFILCSARKKLANLLTFAVLNHSIQVYVFVCLQKNAQTWHLELNTIYRLFLLTWSKKAWFLASELACFSTFSLIPRTILTITQFCSDVSWQKR